MMIGQLDMPKMTNNDLVMKLDPEKIPNLQHVSPEYQDDYFVPQISSGGVLAYNENYVETPDSWGVFWDEQYKGKIGILETSRMFSLYMSALMLGPDVPYGGDWNEGWDGLMDHEGEVWTSRCMPPTSSWATPWPPARSGSPLAGEPGGLLGHRGGRTHRERRSKEGTYPYLSGACIFKNANNPEAPMLL